jgi:hypothetical protein
VLHAHAGVPSQHQKCLVHRFRCEKVSDREEFPSWIFLCQFGYSTKCHLTYILEFWVSCTWYCVDTSTCSPLPSSGYRGRPFRSPVVLHLRGYYGIVRLLAYPCLPPPGSLGSRFYSSRVRSLPMGDPLVSRNVVLFGLGRTAPSSGGVESSPGFTGTPVEGMPRARDSGDPSAASRCRLPECCFPRR